MPLVIQSAEILTDGRMLRLTFTGSPSLAVATPFSPTGGVTIGGVSVKFYGGRVEQTGGVTRWVTHFVTQSIVAHGTTAPTVSGLAGSVVDGVGNAIAAFAGQAVTNLSKLGSDGFTTQSWTPGPGAPDLYVSPATGNDANPGTQASPLATTARAFTIAKAAARGAHINLKRGETHVTNDQGWTNGSDAEHPFILQPYGAGSTRPIVRSTTGAALNWFYVPFEHVVIRGIEVTNATPGTTGGVRFANSMTNLVLDDVVIRDSPNNLVVQGNDSAPGDGVLLNRIIVLDAWDSGTSHAQGIYSQGVKNLIVAECTFENNGRNHPDKVRDIFMHNLYLAATCENPILRGNYITRGGSHGAQVRNGGIVASNYFGANAIASFIGTNGGAFVENVVEKADDMDVAFVRGFGLSMNGAKTGLIHANVVVNRTPPTPYAQGIFMEGVAASYVDTRITGNILYKAGYLGLLSNAGTVMVQGNTIGDNLDQGVFIQPSPPAWAWLNAARNKYGTMTAKLFSWGPTRASLTEFQIATGEDLDSTYGTLDIANPTYTLDGSVRTAFRERPPGVWGSQYEIATIYAAFRTAYSPSSGVVPADPGDSSGGAPPSTDPEVYGITIAPSVVTVVGGSVIQLNATVYGVNSPSQAVTWSATAGTIGGSGVFTAPAATPGQQTITIMATSVLNPSKSGLATVTVQAADLPPPDPNGRVGFVVSFAGPGGATVGIVITFPAP